MPISLNIAIEEFRIDDFDETTQSDAAHEPVASILQSAQP
jgi:hypothetical protein